MGSHSVTPGDALSLPAESEARYNIPYVLALIRYSRPVCRTLAAVFFLTWLSIEYLGVRWQMPRLMDLAVNHNPPVWLGQTWRLLVAPFIHDGGMHLCMVLMMLLFFGRIAEDLYGRVPFAILCGAAALVSQAASLALGSTSTCGGSPIDMAIFGALAVGLTLQAPQFDTTVRAGLAGGLVAAVLLLGALPMSGLEVNAASHLGGLMAGLMLAPVLLPVPLPVGARAVMGSSTAVMAVCLLLVGLVPRPEELSNYLQDRSIELYRQEHYEAAIPPLQQAINLTLTDAVPQYLMGFVHYHLGHPREAETFLRQAVMDNPQFTEGWEKLAQLAIEEDEADNALGYLRQERHLLPHDPSLALLQGEAFMLDGHIDKALAAYREALSMKGDDEQAHLHLGLAYGLQGDRSHSRTELEAARPDPDAAVALADLNVDEGRDNPDAPVQQVLSRPQKSVAAEVWEGDFEADQLHPDRALQMYRQAREAEPDNAGVLLHLARLWRAQGLTDAAHHCARLILRQPVENQSQRRQHGEAALILSDLPLARTFIPTDAAYLQAANDWEAARSEYRTSITASPLDGSLWFELGWTAWHLQDRSQAAACFDRAVALSHRPRIQALATGYLALMHGERETARSQAARVLVPYPGDRQAIELADAVKQDSPPGAP